MSGLPGSEFRVYEAASGEVRVDVRLDQETVWLSQEQMAALFGRERSVVTKHLRNVFKEGELDPSAVCAKFAHTASDGKNYVVDHYNLDAILSVGYRVNSKRGTQFRIWATRMLREHLVRGFTLDRQRLAQNSTELEAALALVRRVARSETLTMAEGRGLVDVIARYTQTFLLLQRYDEGLLERPVGSPGAVTACPRCSEVWTRAFSENPHTQRWNRRQHTCCTSSSRTIPSQTATSGLRPSSSWTSSTAMDDCFATVKP